MRRVIVLGAGRQGLACAYDLLERCGVEQVTLADLDCSRLPDALRPALESGRLRTVQVDALDGTALQAVVRGHGAVACALPYTFNVAAARAAVAARAHYCDLGGNTAAVFEQRGLEAEARAEGLSVVPDCGLAPGLVNVLAAEGVRRLGSARHVRMFVGGLPERPRPPLNYQVVYSLRGVLDYYTTPAIVLRGGRRLEVEALSEIEEIDFGPPLGRLEAFHTAGGVSTLPWAWEGKVDSLEYKTLRYPGHAAVMRAIRDLGLLDETAVEVGGARLAPREMFIHQAEPRLRSPGEPDLVALQVEVTGATAGTRHAWRLLGRHDAGTGFSAMARITGFSLSITCLMQLEGLVLRRGVATPDEAVPAAPYLEALRLRDLAVNEVAAA